MLTSKRRVCRAARGSRGPQPSRLRSRRRASNGARFSTGSAPSPCASGAAPGGVGSAGGWRPLLRLRQDGPVAPGQGSGSPGSKAPLLLLLKGGPASACTAAAPRNAGEYQFSAQGGLRPPSRARTASARKPVSPLGTSKPADIPRLSSVLFVALKFQEERGAMANKFAYFSFRF